MVVDFNLGYYAPDFEIEGGYGAVGGGDVGLEVVFRYVFWGDLFVVYIDPDLVWYFGV